MNEIFVIQNVSINEIELKDFGLLISADTSIDLGDFDRAAGSDELNNFLLAGDVVRLIDGQMVNYEEAFKTASQPFITVDNDYLDLYNTTDTRLNLLTYTDIPWSGVRKITDDFSHTAGETEITFVKSGTYIVMARISTNHDSDVTRTSSTARLSIDTGSGFNPIPGTDAWMYNRDQTNGYDTCSIFCILDVNPGYKIKISAIAVSGSANIFTLNNACSLVIFSAKGEKGESGFLNIQNEGTNIAAGSFTTLNFTGKDVNATDEGGGVAKIDFSFSTLAACGTRRSTTLTPIPNTWSDLTMDITDIQTDPSVIYHDTVNTDRIYVYEDGIYFVQASGVANNQLETRIRINDTTVIPGTSNKAGYNPGTINADWELTTFRVVDLSSGDYLTPQVQATLASQTLQAGFVMSIFKLSGVKGDKGDKGDPGTPGSGANIIVSQNGVAVPGSPFSDLNFQGTYLNLSSIDGSTVDISIGYPAPQVYGTYYQLSQDLTSSTSNSTSPQTKITLVTSDLPLGTYKITAHWLWSRNTASNSARFDITLNGTPQGTRSTIEIEAGDTTDIRPETRIFYRTISGVNTILLRYWGESTGNSTTISDATIEIIRVS